LGASDAPQSSGLATGAAEAVPGRGVAGVEPAPAGFDGVSESGAFEAPAASSPAGTATGAAQYGHFTRFPADSSRARNRFPHDGQPSVIGMTLSAE
jgi:hypothetical protein